MQLVFFLQAYTDHHLLIHGLEEKVHTASESFAANFLSSSWNSCLSLAIFMMSVLLTRPNRTPCKSHTNTFPMRVRVIFINASSALLLGSMTTRSSRGIIISPAVSCCLLSSGVSCTLFKVTMHNRRSL